MDNILILANSSTGLYDFRNELIEEMLKTNHVIVSLPDKRVVDKLEAEGCEVLDTYLERRGMNPIKDLKLLKTYLGYMKKYKPKMVLTYTIKPNIYGGLACRMTGTPYICNITGLGLSIQNDNFLSKILLMLYRIATKRTTCMFFQNESNREFMNKRGVGRKNAAMLPGSGVNVNKHKYIEYPAETDKKIVLTVIRIMKVKGATEYLECVRRICEERQDVKFVLAGAYEEDYIQEYKPVVEDLVSKGYLEYLGYVYDMDGLYGSSHIVVNPTHSEGMSNVLLEAQACGRPVVATDIPGCREAMIDGRTGYLCEVKSVDSLCESLNRILDLDENSRREMGLAGRKYVEENFDRQIVVDAYKELLNR